ncbi:MAG: 6-carboxytetrahydropterin synthase QueD [Thermodesulfobacteriota bacterium]|mgnify:CR=1 FL=1|nr:6-carboxytetrahydropterin synthase QueD [Thermodesulfobacteriota bacterium]MCU4138258.1 6-pyruvoyl-tetrahydropterin synthase [Thermodesulfobacteriota bacterium]RKX61821.1 MAG: 6-carboxytetrahydropterin synthase QueD [Thermodesulfobacteriota bacterium]
MFRLKVQDYFSSAHYLRNYKGSCENLHGHNWKVELLVEGSQLNNLDILIDFKILKSILKETLDELDHKLLNEIPYFKNVNPSSERLAEYIFKKIKDKLSQYSNIKVKEVTVYETDKVSATYYE